MEAIKPRQLIKEVEMKYPTVWSSINEFRVEKDWPDWCYIPIEFGLAIASQDDVSSEQILFSRLKPAVITAAASWRISQGIYRFNSELYNELVNQPLEGNIPCDVLKRLPEYCVYIETQDAIHMSLPLEGFFAHLEYDSNTHDEELRFVFITKTGEYIPESVQIGDMTLEEGLDMTFSKSENAAKSISLGSFETNKSALKGIHRTMKEELGAFIQLVLYLCAENADMVKPPHPVTWKQRNNKIEPKKAVKFVKVGQEIGEVLRVYKKGKSEENVRYVDNGVDTEHSSKRPHMRKAHWHHYRVGTNRQELIIRWLPPIPVNMNDNLNIPTTINKVEQ